MSKLTKLFNEYLGSLGKEKAEEYKKRGFSHKQKVLTQEEVDKNLSYSLDRRVKLEIELNKLRMVALLATKDMINEVGTLDGEVETYKLFLNKLNIQPPIVFVSNIPDAIKKPKKLNPSPKVKDEYNETTKEVLDLFNLIEADYLRMEHNRIFCLKTIELIEDKLGIKFKEGK